MGTRGIAIAASATAIASAAAAWARRSSTFPAMSARGRANIRASNAAESGGDSGAWRFAHGVKAVGCGESALSAVTANGDSRRSNAPNAGCSASPGTTGTAQSALGLAGWRVEDAVEKGG